MTIFTRDRFIILLKILLNALLFFTLLLPIQLSAKEFRILTEEFPPYNYLQNGKVVGISAEIVQEMLKRLGHSKNIEVLPWTEAYTIAKKKDNIILFSTTRLPAREALFKWVGPLVPNNTVFFARKDSSLSIKNLNDAKKVKSIGVYSDDSGQLILKEKGFTNLSVVIDSKQNVLKLANGEIDLWIINDLTGKNIIRDAGFSAELEKIYEIQKDYMYMAFSKSTPDSVIEKWQKVLDDIKSDGTYAQIFSKRIMSAYVADVEQSETNAIGLSVEEQQWTKKHPIIRIASDPDYAPFQYTDINGKSQGLANDYLSLVEKKLGVHFEMVSTPSWNASLKSVKNRKTDMVVVAVKNTQREKYMSFTSSYAVFPDVIITRKNAKEISSIVQLYGKTLSTVKGFAINDFIRKYHPNIRLVFKPDVASALRSVSMGENDATVINVATASDAINKANITNLRIDAETGFTNDLSFASRNDWPMLNTLLEKALNTITKEEKKKLLHKWISISYPSFDSLKDENSIHLTEVEKTWLESHPVITAVPDANWAPAEFFDKDGKYSGMSADYIALMEKRLGIKFQILHIENWKEAVQKVGSNEIDMLTAAAKTPKRAENMLFTESYLSFPTVIVVNEKESGTQKMDDLKDKVVAIVAGYALQEYIQDKYPEVHIEFVSSVSEGLHKVSYGEVYAFIDSIATISYAIEKEMITNLRIAGEAGYTYNVGFASSNKSPILNQILSKGLASISKEERQAIFSKWILVAKEPWKLSIEVIITLSVLAALLFIIAIIIWNRMLIRKVSERTTELNKTLKVSEVLREKADTAQKDAEHANRAKSNFLATMSHEIRTPMNAIIGMADLILKTQLTKEQKEYVNIFQNAGENLLNIINDILDISKIESGSLTLEVMPFDLNKVLERVGEIMAIRAHESGLELGYYIQKDAPTLLMGDSSRLQQILINLIGNAIKFTNSGEIVIRIQKDDSYETSSLLHVCVSDTGVGIALEKRGLIFDSFSQADSSITRKFGGTGLGLSISKKLVNKMGGEIWVDSNPDGGSMFHFTMKVTLQSDTQKQGQEYIQNTDFSKLNVLVVDDNKTNRFILTKMLQSWNINTKEVESGEAALEAIKKSQLNNEVFDLVLLDGHMPSMDGFEVVKRMKNDQKILDVTVTMLTSDNLDEHIAKALSLGVHSYMVKPIKRSALYTNLLEILNTNEPIKDKPNQVKEKESNKKVPSLKVLFVDDDPINRKVGTIMLEVQKHVLTTVSGGKEAIEVLKKEHFDIIFMDVSMQDMDGYEATKLIREMELETDKHVPIVALTALVFKEDKQKCFDSGMDLYVSKPFRSEDLEKAIADAFKKSKLRDEVESLLSPDVVSSTKVLDKEAAFARAGNDFEALAMIAEIYFEYSKEQLSKLKDAVKDKDANEINRLAHAIKGSLGTLGSTLAFESAFSLEKAGKSAEVENAAGLLDILCSDIEAFDQVLKNFIQEETL